ncbi:Mg-protoporphyrin IX methyl transferase [Rubripirellula lacrimiformis]|uniref:Mg-protoporphyrin IX methyl transferase n=1 Tax=Rubripirellula lacrimiformis TaxID=1930273 RepID=A0A517NBA6_9BACT|nr:hypothetical protein [Rubripirellula lacrimiformis]QDT04416.1 Mg-protoporphyrin IX methyl transferase [Rubripirellula lacrimiformis]
MLESIAVPDDLWASPLSPEASELLRDADQRIVDFMRRGPLIDNFVVCDFRLVDAALEWIQRESLASGERFCEWGSGFGVVTMMAALRGWEASGIEVDPDLVDQAQALAEDHEIEANFAIGSFIPAGGEAWIPCDEQSLHIETDLHHGYDELEIQLSDVDLVFMYPWPGEHIHSEAIFDRYAAIGSLLLTYHGTECLQLQRKTGHPQAPQS